MTKNDLSLILLLFVLLAISVLDVNAQCTTGCDISTSATSITTSANNQVICITATPSGNVGITLNHSGVTFRVCPGVSSVTFNSLNINAGRPNISIETWGDNTTLAGVSIGDNTFSFISHANNAVITSVTANKRFNFQAKNGGTLSLPSFNTSSDGGVLLADTNSVLTISGVTIQGSTDIITRQGAVSNFNSNVTFNNNANVINQGIMNITGNLTYQASSNTLDNSCGESEINITDRFQHDSGPISNGGLISAGSIRINSNATMNMTMSAGGRLQTTGALETMNQTNYITYSGPAGQCANFKIGSISNWNNNLTGSANIYYDGPSTSSRPGSATISSTDCSNFRAFCNPILPVKWLSLVATSISNGSIINWSVLPDYESSGMYIVEYSYDFKQFHQAGIIYAEKQEIMNYEYEYSHDFTPSNTIVYYRVRYINNNGEQSMSNTVVLNSHIEREIFVYPNPLSEEYFYIHNIDEQDAVIVYDVLGREIPVSITINGSSAKTKFVSQPEPGLYLIHLVSEGNNTTYRLVVN